MIPFVEYEDRADKLRVILNRSASFSDDIDASVRAILADVQQQGGEAVLEYTERFDGVRPAPFKVPSSALDEAVDDMDDDLRAIIEDAAANIRRFHKKQTRESWFTDDGEGTVLGQRVAPLERAGLYVPGGTATYPSSLLMTAIPAQVAGVDDLHLVSPPQPDGRPNSHVMATAALLGLEHVYAVGGAQAVGALAFGAGSIPAVDKIVGPGNAYVAAAKRQVFGHVDIDSVAGPSEIVVLADDTARPEWVAADLLSQAEHDERASAVLITPDRALAEAVDEAVEAQIIGLPRRKIVSQALADYGACVVTPTLDEAISLTNEIAPEHLELQTREPWSVMTRIRHAGAIFLGDYASEPVGDYFAGPNHVLPTGGAARYASALGVDDFLRRQSVISYSAEKMERDASHIAAFARAEGLEAHARAVERRFEEKEEGLLG